MTKNRFLLLTIIFLVLIRIPALVSWNKYMTGNDAAIYMEKGIHLAEGKGFTSSICRFIPGIQESESYIARFGNRTQEIKVAPLYIFIISGLYRLAGQDYYIHAINLFNLAIFIAALLMIFYCLIPLFTTNYKIGLMTIFMVGLNFVFFEGMFGAHMETLSLFLFVCTFVWHHRVSGSMNVKWPEILGYSILLSLLFLAKYSSIPFVAAFVLHHLVARKYGRFFVVAFLVAMLAGSWFILRDLLLQGRVISGFALSPFADKKPDLLSPEQLKSFLFGLVGLSKRLTQALFDINGLAFLFPFTVIYFVGHKMDRLKQINWLLLMVSVTFFALYGYVDLRYIYPIFIPLIPASLMILSKLLGDYGGFVKKTVFMAIFVIFAGYQLRDMVFFTNSARKLAADREAVFTAADELLKEAAIPDKDCVLTNILGYNVHARIGVVIAPSLSGKGPVKMTELYDLDYILYARDQLNTTLMWDQYGHIDVDEAEFSLIAISRSDPRVKLYAPAGRPAASD